MCRIINWTPRYDYEEVSSEGAQKLVDNLNELLASSTFKGQNFDSATGPFTTSAIYNFSYTDPIDGSVSKNQGHVIQFTDGSRIVFRLSGTGSQGATVRLYVERYTQDKGEYGKEAADGLKGLIEVALKISKLQEFLDRTKPTVITVSISALSVIPVAHAPSSSKSSDQRTIIVENKLYLVSQRLSQSVGRRAECPMEACLATFVRRPRQRLRPKRPGCLAQTALRRPGTLPCHLAPAWLTLIPGPSCPDLGFPHRFFMSQTELHQSVWLRTLLRQCYISTDSLAGAPHLKSLFTPHHPAHFSGRDFNSPLITADR